VRPLVIYLFTYICSAKPSQFPFRDFLRVVMVLMLVIWFNKRIIVHFYYNRKDRQSLFESVHHKNVIFIHLLSLLPSLTFIFFYLRLQFTIWHLHSVKPTITVFIFSQPPIQNQKRYTRCISEWEAVHTPECTRNCIFQSKYQRYIPRVDSLVHVTFHLLKPSDISHVRCLQEGFHWRMTSTLPVRPYKML